MNRASTEVVLFDLGGVLADLGDPVGSIGLDLAKPEFWEIWVHSEFVRGYESGRLSIEQFLPGIAADLGVEDISGFEARLRSWELKLYQGVGELMETLKDRVALALLSNTNDIHWEQVSAQTNAFDSFSELFLSFETGHCKPSLETFEHAISVLGCKPQEVLFLDDTRANLESASRLGIDGKQVAGIAQVQSALERFL